MAELRLFIALNFSREMLTKIAHAVSALKEHLNQPGLRWVPIDKMHLTLKFFGSTPETRLPDLRSGIIHTASHSHICSADIRGLGAFPSISNPNVIWIGLKPDTSLHDLFSTLEKHLKTLDFPPEARGFSPHITLARVSRSASAADRKSIAATLKQIDLAPLGTDKFDSLYLYKSQFQNGNYVYSILQAEPLGKIPG